MKRKEKIEKVVSGVGNKEESAAMEKSSAIGKRSRITINYHRNILHDIDLNADWTYHVVQINVTETRKQLQQYSCIWCP